MLFVFCTVCRVCSCIPFPPAWDLGTRGTQASMECSPLLRHPAGVEVLETCAALVALPWEEKQDQPPKGCVWPWCSAHLSGLWFSLTMTRRLQQISWGAVSPLTCQEQRVFFPSADSHDVEDHLPLQLLKAQPCRVYLGSQPQGPPERSVHGCVCELTWTLFPYTGLSCCLHIRK